VSAISAGTASCVKTASADFQRVSKREAKQFNSSQWELWLSGQLREYTKWFHFSIVKKAQPLGDKILHIFGITLLKFNFLT